MNTRLRPGGKQERAVHNTDEEKFGIYKEMLLRASQALSRRKSVVVDATFFHHTLREMFLRLARGYGEPVRLIEVTADENLIRYRLAQRRPHSEADFAVYEKVRDAFEEITMPHLIIQSTNENVNEMLNVSLEYIESGIARSN